MDVPAFQTLLISGEEAIRAAIQLNPREDHFLPDFQFLCRQFPPDLARSALEIALLRKKGESKFPYAAKLFFTRAALEQSSSHEVAHYRAARYEGFQHLIDLGCSVGMDTIALAKIAPTIGIDIDLLRLNMACANLIALELDQQVDWIQSDLANNLPLKFQKPAGVFFDPSRRLGDRRIHSVMQYQPPLSVMEYWLGVFPALGVKISPGVNLHEISHLKGELEFISLHGELKEAVLWFGPLATTSRRATILPGPHTMITENAIPLPLSNPKAFLVEPDPAIIRTGLVGQLGHQLQATQLDPTIAYLTAEKWVATPFARGWEIVDWMGFNLKKLKMYLREHDVGTITIKKRGSPIEPDVLMKKLDLRGGGARTLVLTKREGDPVVLICSPNPVITPLSTNDAS